jgi:hypothetical protein
MNPPEYVESALAEIDELSETARKARVKAEAADEAVLAAAVRLVMDTMLHPIPPDFHEIARRAGVTPRALRTRLTATPGFEERFRVSARAQLLR